MSLKDIINNSQLRFGWKKLSTCEYHNFEYDVSETEPEVFDFVNNRCDISAMWSINHYLIVNTNDAPDLVIKKIMNINIITKCSGNTIMQFPLSFSILISQINSRDIQTRPGQILIPLLIDYYIYPLGTLGLTDIDMSLTGASDEYQFQISCQTGKTVLDIIDITMPITIIKQYFCEVAACGTFKCANIRNLRMAKYLFFEFPVENSVSEIKLTIDGYTDIFTNLICVEIYNKTYYCLALDTVTKTRKDLLQSLDSQNISNLTPIANSIRCIRSINFTLPQNPEIKSCNMFVYEYNILIKDLYGFCLKYNV